MTIRDKQLYKFKNYEYLPIKQERFSLLTDDMTIEDKLSFIITGYLFEDIRPAQKALIIFLMDKAQSICDDASFYHDILKKHLELDAGLQGLM